MHGDPSQSVVERFAQMTPDQFITEVESLWQAGYKVVETIQQLVRDEEISPIQGLGIIGCTTSQLYAYNAFHGDASPADLVSALASQTRSPAGART